MQRRIALFALLLTVVAAVAVPVRTVDSQAHDPQDASAALQQVLVAAVDREDTPGAVGLVVDKNGVLFEGAAGKSDVAKGAPLGTDAIFDIRSMTKPVTSVAAMMLVEQGKLSLEDPVSKYLPGFDKLQVITKFNEADGTYETRLARQVMTVHHLMAHTSGIGYRFSNPILARLQQGNNKFDWALPLVHEPGEKWTYGARAWPKTRSARCS